MDADSAEKNGFAVKQDVRATCLDRAKPDVIRNLVRLAHDLNGIKFGMLRRPKGYVCFDRKLGSPLRVGLDGVGNPGFRNPDGYSLMQLLTIELQPAAIWREEPFAS